MKKTMKKKVATKKAPAKKVAAIKKIKAAVKKVDSKKEKRKTLVWMTNDYIMCICSNCGKKTKTKKLI